MKTIWEFSNIDENRIQEGGNFTDYPEQKIVDIDAAGAANSAMPLKLYGKERAGCNRLNLNATFASGIYQLTVSFKEPTARIDFYVFFDGRLIATNAVYFGKKQSMGKVDHIYDLICSADGNHNVCIELPKAESKEELEIIEVTLRKSEEASNQPIWDKDQQGKLYLDIWGWQAPLTYSRTHPVDITYYKNNVIKQSAKWGANLVHYWNWTGEDFVHDLLHEIHAHDFIYDEHWFPPRFPQDLPLRNYRIEPTLDRLKIWSENVLNAAKNGWMGAGDGWIPEEKGKGADGACSNSENMIRANHTIWAKNPGAYTSVFTNRPNENPTGDGNTTEVYKGPNFIYSVGTHQGLGIDDKFSQRLFYGNTSFKNEFNNMFLYLQGECRPTPHRGPFGGRSDPDFWLKQLCDFFRPRAKNPEDIHESGIFWMLESELALPEELREYVYSITVDPIRAAVATRLTSTGMDGSIWNTVKVARQKKFTEEHVGPAPRDEHPASTSFIQNNYLRLYRYALGDKGVLVYDTEQLAHYDSNSMCIPLSTNFIRTVPKQSNRKFVQLFIDNENSKASSDLPDCIKNNESNITELYFTSDTGTYMLSIGQLPSDKASTIKVSADYMEVEIYKSENIYRTHEIPLFVHGNGKHIIEIEIIYGEGHDVDFIELEDTSMQTSIIKSIGKWDNSHEELQHKVTKGIDGYEFGEFHYPVCYLDLDEEMASEFPAGLAYGFPNPLNLDFSAPKGAYLVVVGAKARIGAGSLISVGLNPDAGLYKHPDFVPVEYVRYCGEYEIPGDGEWHRRVVPLNLYKSGKNRLQLGLCLNGREGHYFDAFEIIESPVKHDFVEYGGHKAVMDEEFTIILDKSVVKEKRRYRMYNDTPYFMTTIERNVQGDIQDLSTLIDCEGYSQLVLDGKTYSESLNGMPVPGKIVFTDTTGLRPDLVILIMDSGSVTTLDWSKKRRLTLNSSAVRKESIRFGIAVVSPAQDITAMLTAGIFNEDEISVMLPDEKMTPIEITNKHPVPVVKVLKIANPQEGPYFVEEKGWWMVRGGQTSREDRGTDYLKVYLPANGATKIQSYGYIYDVVKPGYGCQHILAIKDVKYCENCASCIVKVLSVTPALFAPRIQFNKRFDSIMVNGEDWSYFDDEGLVLLPNRPGEYKVEVSGKGLNEVPHISRTGAMVTSAKFIDTEGCLEIVTALPTWVNKLPEDQLYMGLINYDKNNYAITDIRGAKIVNQELLGDVISFKPGTTTVYFKKQGM